MPRVYDDISHLRQPYLQSRLGGPESEAQALGVYMTRGPVDAAPLPVHRGYGVYQTSGPVDQPPIPVHQGIGGMTSYHVRGPVGARIAAPMRSSFVAPRIQAPVHSSFVNPRFAAPMRPSFAAPRLQAGLGPAVMQATARASQFSPQRGQFSPGIIGPAPSNRDEDVCGPRPDGSGCQGSNPYGPSYQTGYPSWQCNRAKQQWECVWMSVAGLGDIAPLAASAQGGAKYQELSPLDAINVQTWLSTKAVSLPATPSPDVKTPGSTYVAMSPLDLPVPPGYAPLNVPGALWAAQEVAAGRFIVVANVAWDPDVSNFFASVEPSQIAKQAAPGGNWAVVMKPLSAKPPITDGGMGPIVGMKAPTCAELGEQGQWPNCQPYPDVRFPPKAPPPKIDRMVVAPEDERAPGVPTAAIVVGVASVTLLLALALKKK